MEIEKYGNFPLLLMLRVSREITIMNTWMNYFFRHRFVRYPLVLFVNEVTAHEALEICENTLRTPYKFRCVWFDFYDFFSSHPWKFFKNIRFYVSETLQIPCQREAEILKHDFSVPSFLSEPLGKKSFKLFYFKFI